MIFLLNFNSAADGYGGDLAGNIGHGWLWLRYGRKKNEVWQELLDSDGGN